MYLEHFGLAESPFRITPHTEFFFEGAERGATLEALLYAVLHDEGIVKVSGEIGSGKTMLCRMLMERLPGAVETVFLANPSFSREEILYAIADELDLQLSGEPAAQALRALQAHLIEVYASGRRVVILIDEAHAMPQDTLEEVRLMSNLESSRHKLMQIVLFGQPELDEALARPSMRQLRDRITHSFRMRPLTGDEVARYVDFRLRAAGYRGVRLFQPAALAAIARASSGLTRRINVLADKALLAAFADNEQGVAMRHVRAAIADTEFAPVTAAASRRASVAAGALALVLAGSALGGGLVWLLQPQSQMQRLPEVKPPEPLAEAPPGPASASAPQEPKAQGPAPAAGVAAAASTPIPTSEAPMAEEPAAGAGVQAQVAGEPKPQAAAPEQPRSPLLSPEQLRRIGRYGLGQTLLLRERVAATRERLLSEPDDSYSVELFEAENSDPARMERFLIRARDMVPLEDLYVVPIASADRYRIRVVYGVFASREAAAEAARRLPPKYQRAFELELRQFGELRHLL
jgi:type II secretory pathway predicted ATPase ExeA